PGAAAPPRAPTCFFRAKRAEARLVPCHGTFFPQACFCRVSLSIEREGPVPNSPAAVAQSLPFLRRYARALTGNQASGDAYVAATLEAFIADRAVIEDPRGPRVALYRLFTKIWNSVSVNGAATSGEG